MDGRILVLPMLSVVLVLILLTRPDITGLMAAKPSDEPGMINISANVSITIKDGGFIPEGSIVTVYLDDRSSSMGFGEFVKMTGAAYSRTSQQATGYEGYGYGGPYTYSLDVSEFGIDTAVAKGRHTLMFKVGLDDRVFSSNSQNIDV